MATMFTLFFIQMKNIYAIPGAILVVVAILLVAGFSSSLGQGLNTIGVSDQTTISSSGTQLLSLKSSNYSAIPFQMMPNYMMTATIQSNPQGIDAFVMNQGNFSLFKSTGGDAGSVYIYEHSLNVSSTTMSFTTNTPGNYSLVFTVPVNGLKPDVIVDLTVFKTFTTVEQDYLPYVIAIIGIILIAIGVMSRSNGKIAATVTQNKQTAVSQTSKPAKTVTPVPVTPKPVTMTRCKYCGTAMRPNQVFCPSCSKSQV